LLVGLAWSCLSLASAAQPQSPSFELRWGGLVHDTVSADGLENWTAEDGGRIRHRQSNQWTFQTVPAQVKDTLRRVFFLPNRLDGWAVGQNGWIVRTSDGGAHWNVLYRMPAVLPRRERRTKTCGTCTSSTPTWAGWSAALDLDHEQRRTELDALHADRRDRRGRSGERDRAATRSTSCRAPASRPCLDGRRNLRACCSGSRAPSPGFVFRSVDGVTWQIVFDVRDICATLPVCAQVICDPPAPGEKPIPYEPVGHRDQPPSDAAARARGRRRRQQLRSDLRVDQQRPHVAVGAARVPLRGATGLHQLQRPIRSTTTTRARRPTPGA
jgi:hypothetical protein